MAAIDHDERHHVFHTEVDGHRAYLHYRLAPGIITFVHTGVAPELEGRGVGSALARAGLDHARAAGLKVVPKCPFVAAWLKRHHEYDDILLTPPQGS
ncbi:MAG: N-acetyltransferase [Bauldia sp.]|nr:N-acetyltransferase [Bauldia sp.]